MPPPLPPVGDSGALPNMDVLVALRVICKALKISMRYEYERMRELAEWMPPQHLLVASAALRQALSGGDAHHTAAFLWHIEGAVTLRGGAMHRRRGASALQLLEALFHVFNNMSERLNLSFFYYFPVSPATFVSVGRYAPVVSLLVAAAFVPGALYAWRLSAGGVSPSDYTARSAGESVALPAVGAVTAIVACAHMIVAPFESAAWLLGMSLVFFAAVGAWCVAACSRIPRGWVRIKVASLVVLGLQLLVMSFHNPSLCVLTALATVPCALLMAPPYASARTSLAMAVMGIVLHALTAVWSPHLQRVMTTIVVPSWIMGLVCVVAAKRGGNAHASL